MNLNELHTCVPRTTVDAKMCGSRYYFNGAKCKNGNISLKLTSNRCCRCDECKAEKAKDVKERYKTNKNDPDWKAKRKEQKAREYLKNKDSDFWQSQQKDYRERTKDRKKEYDKKYAKENSERKSRNAVLWAKNNKESRAAIIRNYESRRRSQKSSGVATKELRKWVANAEKKCYWCGNKCEKNYHVDHYMPLSKGGPHEIENLVIACAPCNLKKNAKHPYEFAKEVGRLF